MTGIYFDIGSNIGNTIKEYCNKGYIVHAFEPNTECINIIKKRKDIKFKNLYLNDTAVSLENKINQTFYITKNNACSSLKKIKLQKDLYNIHCHGDLVKNRLKVLKEINVKTTRLDYYINQNNINKIDFIKIDAQGSDFDVIKSLGDKLKICRKIKVECMFDGEDVYYEKECKKKEIIDYLTEHNFKLINEKNYNKSKFCDLIFLNP